MALPIIAQVYRVALEWFCVGQSAVNVIHVATDAAGKTPLQVFTCLDAHVSTLMFDSVTADAAVATVNITPLDGVTPTGIFPTGSVAKWGGNGSTDFIPAAATIIKLATATRGRSFRGRIFLPFLAEDANSRGQIDGPTATAMSTAWTTFAAAIDADATTPMNLVVASYKLATAAAVTELHAETTAATQERRQARLRGVV
jgi:hypothetical protein